VDWLLTRIPDGVALDLDLITSSRGALVARILAEKQGEFSLGSRSLSIGRVVFGAGPNSGTVLADDQHLGRFVDAFTNLMSFVPDNAVTDVLSGVVTVVKQLGVGVLKGLDGIQSMRPGGPFLAWLNQGAKGEPAYYALASNYEPTSFGLSMFKDRIMDRIFGADNDLVVPTAGVYDANGSACFPIADRLVLGPEDGVTHGGFFSNAKAMDQMRAWLRA
jgi:hypothetical protein